MLLINLFFSDHISLSLFVAGIPLHRHPSVEFFLYNCHLYLLWSQIKSNQIRFYFNISNIHLKEKKISKKLFTQLYSITNNNKLYIWFKYFDTSLWKYTIQWKYVLVSFRSTAFYSNLIHILQRHFGPCHFLISFLNSCVCLNWHGGNITSQILSS